MFKAFIKHYLLIVIGIVSSILLADYWYNNSQKAVAITPLELTDTLPLIQAYCRSENCREQTIPFALPAMLVDKTRIMFPPAQTQLLDNGKTVSVADAQGGNYYYINYDNSAYLQLGPIVTPTPETNHLYTSTFYILLAAALFLGLYPLFRDMAKLNDVVRKFEAQQELKANDFPDSSYFQQIFLTIRGMLEKIGRLVALQKELSDTLSHEVRTSLSSAKFTLSAMTGESYEQMKPLLDGDISDIERLVQEYLSFSKQEQQCPSLLLKAQSPVAIVEEYMAKLLRFSDKKINFINNSQSMALIDERYFSRVIKNLIDNALKHARYEVIITLFDDDERLVFQIEDDGHGLQSEKFEDLFLAFNREKDDLTGYGLGLAIAKKVVDWHQGEIIAMNSKVLSGAMFIVKLPTAEDEQQVVSQQITEFN